MGPILIQDVMNLKPDILQAPSEKWISYHWDRRALVPVGEIWNYFKSNKTGKVNADTVIKYEIY